MSIGGQGAVQIVPGRSRRRRMLALAVLVAAGAAAAWALYGMGWSAAAACGTALVMSLVVWVLDARRQGQHLVLQFTPAGAWYLWQQGWHAATACSASVSAHGLHLRLTVRGAVHVVSLWRDAVPVTAWRDLTHFAVRQQVLSPDRQAGGAA